MTALPLLVLLIVIYLIFRDYFLLAIQGALTPDDLSMNFYPIQDAAERKRIFPVSAITG